MFINHVDDSDNTNIDDINKYSADHIYSPLRFGHIIFFPVLPVGLFSVKIRKNF